MIRLDKTEAKIYRLEQSVEKQGKTIVQLQKEKADLIEALRALGAERSEEDKTAIADFFNYLGRMMDKIDTAVAWHARTSYPDLRRLRSQLPEILKLIKL